MSATLAIVLAIICLAGGGLLGFLFGRGGSASDAKRAQAVQDEFDAYRRNVTEHFGETAEHFRNIGRQYRELYDHMASGAENLCDTDDRAQLAFPSLRAIEVIADRAESGPATDDATADEATADATSAEDPAREPESHADAGDDDAARSDATEAADDDAPETDGDARRPTAEAGDAAIDEAEGDTDADDADTKLTDAANDADATQDDDTDDADSNDADPDALRRAGAT